MHFEYKYQDKYPEISGSFGARYMNAVRDGRYLPAILFLLGAFICQFLIWIRQTSPNQFVRSWAVFPAALYNGFSMALFVLGLVFLMQPFFAGRLEPIRPLLGGTIYQPLAKLTFGTYLLHLIVIVWFNGTLRQGVWASANNFSVLLFGYTAVTMGLAVIFTLLAETPSMLIERWILFPQPIKPKDEKSQKYAPIETNEEEDPVRNKKQLMAAATTSSIN